MNLSLLKPAILPLVLFFQAGTLANLATQSQYQRAVTFGPVGVSSQVCAVLDADVFTHAAPSLKDLRLYSGQTEIPYAITVSEPLQQETEDARILNLALRGGSLSFYLEMPKRPYTAIVLDLAARDFIVKATVTGLDRLGSGKISALGTFTLFDLSNQHLSRSTSIPLPESTFPFLHVELAFTPVSGGASTSAMLRQLETVRAVTVPPSREAQLSYTMTQQQTIKAQDETRSVATFSVAARVPIERIAFTLPAGYNGSFSRAVRVEARGIKNDAGATATSRASFAAEDIVGTIFRVSRSEAGQELAAESLAIPVSIGSNMQQPALLTVTMDGESGPQIPLTVQLQMHQRRICFDSAAARLPLTLTYGGLSLDAPAYGDPKLLHVATDPRIAELGPESKNASFKADAVVPRLAQHHPILRWIALLGCVCIFALLVFRRSAKHRPH